MNTIFVFEIIDVTKKNEEEEHINILCRLNAMYGMNT